MTDLLDRRPAPVPPAAERPTSTPLVPILMLLVTTGAAIVFALSAYLDDAGATDEISGAAVAAWAMGSLVGLLIFAWWGLLDSQRRSTGTYTEPSFRPRLVAGSLTVVGWIAGLAGALMVGLSVARS